MTTKSGSNSFHGSAYEYYRSDGLAAIPHFATKNPPLHYNLFGASLGLPIVRDRTFFFFNYEGQRQTSSITGTAIVPRAAEVHGDFSANPNIIYDPQTGQPFPGNIIPSNRFDPIGAKLVSFYPAANVPGTNLLRGSDPSVTVLDDYVKTRIDHVFNQNNHIFGRLLAQPDHTNTGPVFPSGVDNYTYKYKDYYYNASVTWNHNFSTTLINELRVTYSRRESLNFGLDDRNVLGKELGIKGVDQSFFPTVNVAGLDTLGANEQQRLQTPITSNSYEDKVSWMHGKHQFKFGFDWRTSADGDLYAPTAGGQFNFDNIPTSNPLSPGTGGSGLASLLLGQVSEGNLLKTNHLHSVSAAWAAFVQDDWRVAPRFTLNLGLRYDLDEPMRESNNQQNSFDTTAINPVSGTPGVVTFAGRNGASIYANRWDKDNFGPRVGFAWNLREAVGGSRWRSSPCTWDSTTSPCRSPSFWDSARQAVSSLLVESRRRFSSPMGCQPSLRQTVLEPGFGAVPVGQRPTTAVTFVAPNHPNGYIYQTNWGIQHQFGGNFLVDVGYLGAFGHHLVIARPREYQSDSHQLARATSLHRHGAPSRNSATCNCWPSLMGIRPITERTSASRRGIPMGCYSEPTHTFGVHRQC